MIPNTVWVSKKDLMDFVERAFSFGESAPSDIGEEIVQEIMSEIFTRISGAEFRTISLDELTRFPQGKIIVHPVDGDGEIFLTSGKPFVKFRSGKIVPLNSANADYWSYPLLVH